MDGQKIIVFGAAKPGIGQAVTNNLLSHGASVVGVTNPEDLRETEPFRSSNANVSWLEVDTFDPTAMVDDLAKIENVNGVVHADMYFYMEKADSFDIREWNRSLSANLTVPKVIGYTVKRAWTDTCTSVVFVTSSEANTGSFGAHAYAATKSAVHNLTKSLANTAEGKTRYNSLAAGWIGGVMDTDEVFNLSREVTPLGRLGAPEEIASAAAWLLGDGSSFINGATLYADGGYTGVDTISKYEYNQEFSVS